MIVFLFIVAFSSLRTLLFGCIKLGGYEPEPESSYGKNICEDVEEVSNFTYTLLKQTSSVGNVLKKETCELKRQ